MISVIIPVYNAANVLRRSLESVAHQTYRDFEVILVDDGSSDDTKALIDDFFKKKSIKYRYVYQANQGPSVARNRAVALAGGEYLAFLDADDEWHPKKLELQWEKAQELKSGFLAASYTYGSFAESDELQIRQYGFKDFLLKNRTSTPCVLLSRELFQKAGGFIDEQRYSEDYNLWLRVAKIEPLYTIIQPPLVRLHKHAFGESGLSADMWQMERGELFNYRMLFSRGDISLLEFCFYEIWSMLRYSRRLILSFIKRFVRE